MGVSRIVILTAVSVAALVPARRALAAGQDTPPPVSVSNPSASTASPSVQPAVSAPAAPASAPSDPIAAPADPSAVGTAIPPPAVSPPAPVDTWAAPSFGSDPLGAAANALDLTLKMYGDTGYAVRNHANQPWPEGTANPNVYAPGVWNSFFAPRLDLFGSADVSKLSFLTEVMFEAQSNEIGVDVERLEISYLVANWLRIRAGRSHVAWGYYNDTYHHGNFFELTTSRPYAVNFEDSFGLILSHMVGVSLDGTFDLGAAGAFRYDAEVGNGHAADITAVPLQYAETNPKAVNLRLRWMPVDGLIVGINGMYDEIPSLAAPDGATVGRPSTEELIAGAHVVYTEHHWLIDVEAFAMRHDPSGAPSPSTNIEGGFAEAGYTVGTLTPYARFEYIHFPSTGDIVYQFDADSAQGALVGYPSIYSGLETFTDARVGIKWVPLPQLALKLEGERLTRDTQDQEIATVKAAFGF